MKTFYALYQHEISRYYTIYHIVDWKVEDTTIEPTKQVSVMLPNINEWMHALYISKCTGWGYRIVDESTGEILEEFDEWEEYWDEPDAP